MKYRIIVRGELIFESDHEEMAVDVYRDLVAKSKSPLHKWHDDTIYLHCDGLPYMSRIRTVDGIDEEVEQTIRDPFADKIKAILIDAGEKQLNLSCESVIEKLTKKIMEEVK